MNPILFREAALNLMFDLLLVTTSQKRTKGEPQQNGSRISTTCIPFEYQTLPT
jgi:hypothetical protein